MYLLAVFDALVKSSPLARADANADDKVQPVPWVFGVATRLDGSKVSEPSSAL